MHGPVWNDPNVGVTGEPLRAPVSEPNYVTTTSDQGKPITIVGEAADRYRAEHPDIVRL